MRFFRAKLENGRYIKAAPIQAVSCFIGSTIIPGKQGDAGACSGRFTSTEAIKNGSIVIGQGEGGIMPLGYMQPFKVERSAGVSGIFTYFLKEEGFIKGANG